MSGSASTFSVYDFIRENLDNWKILEIMHEPPEVEEEKSQGPSKSSVQLSKGQKKKLYRHMDANGEHQRGWNWVDLVSHVSILFSLLKQIKLIIFRFKHRNRSVCPIKLFRCFN